MSTRVKETIIYRQTETVAEPEGAPIKKQHTPNSTKKPLSYSQEELQDMLANYD
jgi:hypothetical protein